MVRGEDVVPRAALDTEFDPRVVVAIVNGSDGSPEDFEFAAVNAAAARDLGFDSDQLIGRRYRDVDPHATEHALWDHLVSVAETGDTLELRAHPHWDSLRGESVVLDLRVGRGARSVESAAAVGPDRRRPAPPSRGR